MEEIRVANPAATGGLTALIPAGENDLPNGGCICLQLPAKSFYFDWSPCVRDSGGEQAKPDLGFPSRSVRPEPSDLKNVGTKLGG